jgi:hypothetical protein
MSSSRSTSRASGKSSPKAPKSSEVKVTASYNSHCSLHNLLCFSFFSLCVLTILFASFEAYQHNWREKDVIGWACAGSFVVLTVFISVRLMLQHFNNWNAGHVQKHVVRIILLLPIYSIESWLALYYRHYSVYIETLKETYEAYVVWNFFFFLIALLGEENHVLSVLRTKGKRGIHTFPFNYFIKSWNGHEIMHKCSMGVLQYVLLKIIATWLVIILQYFDIYDEGEFKLNRGYLYITIINNASQIWALYCLAKFYYIMREELSHYKAVGKFLCVKLVVFWTWWQSIVINFLAYHTTIISSSENNTLTLDENHQGSRFSNSQNISGGELTSWTDGEISKGIQDFLITIEMFIASIAFSYYFTHEEYLYNGGAFHAFSPLHTNVDDSNDNISVSASVNGAGNGSCSYRRNSLFDDSTMGNIINSLSGGATSGSICTHPDDDEDYGDYDDDNEHDGGESGGVGSDRRGLLASERKNNNTSNTHTHNNINMRSHSLGDDSEFTQRNTKDSKNNNNDNNNNKSNNNFGVMQTPHQHKGNGNGNTRSGISKRNNGIYNSSRSNNTIPQAPTTGGGVFSAISATLYPDDIMTDIRKNVFVLGRSTTDAKKRANSIDIDIEIEMTEYSNDNDNDSDNDNDKTDAHTRLVSHLSSPQASQSQPSEHMSPNPQVR